jgi:hypothetical protein
MLATYFVRDKTQGGGKRGKFSTYFFSSFVIALVPVFIFGAVYAHVVPTRVLAKSNVDPLVTSLVTGLGFPAVSYVLRK